MVKAIESCKTVSWASASGWPALLICVQLQNAHRAARESEAGRECESRNDKPFTLVACRRLLGWGEVLNVLWPQEHVLCGDMPATAWAAHREP